jgi:hypothetical protein
MEITYNPGMTIRRTVARRTAAADKAPAVLASLLERLFEGRPIPSSSSSSDDETDWARMVEGFRAYGRSQRVKVELLSPLASKWAATCEIYDNGKDLGIMRAGDTPDDGMAVWITRTDDLWTLRLASQSRREGSTTIREVQVAGQDVARAIDELLGEMTGDLVVAATTAQETYRALLRDFVGPALRRIGYKGPSGQYQRAVGDYRVSIRFRKSRWSTKDRVDYGLLVGVTEPATAELYGQANAEAWAQGREHEMAPAGAWHSSFPGNLGPSRNHWISLRPSDDLSSHADQLLSDLAQYVFPEIERQLQLPLSTPTPPSERPLRPSREELNRRHLSSTVEALRAAGVGVDVPEDFEG